MKRLLTNLGRWGGGYKNPTCFKEEKIEGELECERQIGDDQTERDTQKEWDKERKKSKVMHE